MCSERSVTHVSERAIFGLYAECRTIWSMATVPYSKHIRARFDGNVFVPEQRIDLPAGTVIEGWPVPESHSWPPGYIERTMGAWVGEDLIEPDDSPPLPEEPLS